ncbi:SDR family NAD(P)-dependent oxidoreductase [Acetobacterium tundrae]|uniref:Glucose 1-dehydrogenase n=1 Tax=Acetobacterium tundrae TaxID=132932 RepID=A0ABR6WGI7_9FIRM|nr:SDR family NAD(P)-dependent oxidoreductase [Acetobacterium tundrae]MBC3795605.1 glucose 1-dehydrogenase [Acetobacterium tundrae]
MSAIHQDKVVIITGSSRGIGYSIAEYLSNEGAKIVIIGRYIETAQAAADTLPTDSLAVQCDISREEDVKTMVETVMEKYGKIDVLINNAGVFPVKTFSAMTFEDWRSVMTIDLDGTFIATHAVYKVLEKQKHGKIINIASVAGRIGGLGFTHYSAAKGGVIAFTKALAREAARLNIQVNAIAPGIVETDMAKSNFPQYALTEATKNTPAGRLGTEADLFGIISFLCSPGSDYIIGQTISVDGGYTMI